MSAGGAALPTGDAQPRAGPPWRSSAPVTSVGLPGGCSGSPVGPDPEGSSRIAFPGDALLPPEMMLAPLRGDAQPPPGGLDSGGSALFDSPRGCSALLPPAPGMLPMAPRAGPQWGCSALPCPEGCSASPGRGSLAPGGLHLPPCYPLEGVSESGCAELPHFSWVESGLGSVILTPS